MRLSQAVAGLLSVLVVQSAAGQVAPAPVLELAGPNTVEVGRKIVIKATTTAKKVTWKIPAGVDAESVDGKRLHVWALPGSYTFVAMVPNGDDVVMQEHVLVVTGPRPPPGPDPVPPDPVPPPVVKSFRVIFNTESATNLTAQQNAVCGAKVVRDYLNAKCSKSNNWPDWRNFDPQTSAANEYPPVKALWEAVKPKVTTVPCWVIEVNGKAEILPFPKDAAEALKTLKQYGGE